MYRKFFALLCGLMVMMVSSSAISQTSTYKEYEPSAHRALYFTISFDNRTLSIQFPDSSAKPELSFALSSLHVTSAKVEADGVVLFSPDGLVVGDSTYPYSLINDIKIDKYGDETVIMFYRGASANSTARGNRITFNEPIQISEAEFVRGTVFSVSGNIDIFGEINKNVVSLFGNVYLGKSAVVRGDIATITGDFDYNKKASVYLDIYSGKDKSHVRRLRFHEHHEPLGVTCNLNYNRVDGFQPSLGLKYNDPDSLLPSAWIEGGYAFASDRWRFKAGMEQNLWRSKSLSISGEYYRRLASDDDRLVGNCENTLFALLAREDFKDYYEAEGGIARVKITPMKNLKLSFSVRGEQTNWLESHPHLWSVFCGDKLFSENFNTVEPMFRAKGIQEIDTSTIVSLSSEFDYASRDSSRIFDRSSWRIQGAFQWSNPDLGSDFDFRRYWVSVRRYQETTRRTMLILTGTVGASDGYLPMFQRFYLGGLGSLYGYKNKEFMGTTFWCANTEYRFAFPKSDIALSAIWDIGQIANGALNSSSPTNNSVGAALYIGNDFRISLARRFDSSKKDGFQFYARIGHMF
jgi:hypothetical protein